MRIVHFEDRPDLPWKNGGGTTRELLSAPSGPAGFHWRVSIATIDRDGAFSSFPGIDRTLVGLGGYGRLRISDRIAEVAPTKMVRFDGSEPVSATVRDGPIRVLNIMSVARDWRQEIDVVRAIGMSSSASDHFRMFVILEGGGGSDLQQGDLVLDVRNDEALDGVTALDITFVRRRPHAI